MGGGAAGGLWRHQQWSPSWLPSWILPRIRNQVKTVRIGDFLHLRWKHINKHCLILATRFTFVVAEKLKNMYFQAKTAWPPPNYDVISRNYGNWPSLNLTQHACKGWTNSYCSRGKLRKALGSGIPPPPLRPRVKLCESFLVESPNLYLAFIKTILAGVFRTFGIPLRFLSSKPSFLHDHFTTQHSDLVNRSIHANVFT